MAVKRIANLDSSAYYAARSNTSLEALRRARLGDVREAIAAADHYGRNPGNSPTLETAAAQLDLISNELERRIPIGEYNWTDDYSFMRILTCRNHPSAMYLTKNPWYRSLHLVRTPDGAIPRSPNTGECMCPLRDLVVIGEAR